MGIECLRETSATRWIPQRNRSDRLFPSAPADPTGDRGYADVGIESDFRNVGVSECLAVLIWAPCGRSTNSCAERGDTSETTVITSRRFILRCRESKSAFFIGKLDKVITLYGRGQSRRTSKPRPRISGHALIMIIVL